LGELFWLGEEWRQIISIMQIHRFFSLIKTKALLIYNKWHMFKNKKSTYFQPTNFLQSQWVCALEKVSSVSGAGKTGYPNAEEIN
jgi:hypothetical protein